MPTHHAASPPHLTHTHTPSSWEGGWHPPCAPILIARGQWRPSPHSDAETLPQQLRTGLCLGTWPLQSRLHQNEALRVGPPPIRLESL